MKYLPAPVLALFFVVTAASFDLTTASTPGATFDTDGSPPGEPSSPIAAQTGCPAGFIDIWPGEDIVSIVNSAPIGEQFCIHGTHRIDEALVPKNEQVFWGEDDARISGGQELTNWAPSFDDGYWRYSGPLAANENVLWQYNDAAYSCYEVAVYQDDVFFDDQRMMRVLSLDQLLDREPLPDGQLETPAELGRFFFDYENDYIYIDQTPIGVTVDLAAIDYVVSSDARDVEFHHMTLEKARDGIIHAKLGRSWKIIDSTVRFAHNAGIASGAGDEGNPFLVLRSLITNNGQVGVIGGADYLEIRETELSWNNIANHRNRLEDGTCGSPLGTGGARIFGTGAGSPTSPSALVVDVDAHDNVGAGVHVDIHAQWVEVRNSFFRDNERVGYAHEISCDAEIYFNEFTGNGTVIKNIDARGGGVLLALSNNVWLHDNLFSDNGMFGVYLNLEEHTNMSGVPCMNTSSDSDISDALKHNTVENNLFEMCTGFVGGKTDDSLAVRDNFFVGNSYLLPDPAGFWWHDVTLIGFLTWLDWQAGGQDLTGVTSVGASCSEQEVQLWRQWQRRRRGRLTGR